MEWGGAAGQLEGDDVNLAWSRRAARVMPGGCIGATRLPDDLSLTFTHGQGAHLFDCHGRRYIDYVMGSGPLLLGHAHPSVVAAVQRQAALGSTFYALNTHAIELAERIVASSPCAEGVRFQTTGSEATWAAARIARAATGRSKLLRFEGGLHGGNDLGQTSHVPLRLAQFPEPVPDCAGVTEGFLSEILVAPFNDLEMATSLMARWGREIAAIFVEPVQRAIAPVPGFLDGLRALADAHGAMLVFDEVVTGFRLADGGAQQVYGVKPDLATYGKVIGGGYALSAVAGRWDLLALADPRARRAGPYAFLSGTLTANPVSCTAGAATLDVLRHDPPYDALAARGAALAKGLETSASRSGIALRVMRIGSILQPLFDPPARVTTYRDTLKADGAMATRFSMELVRRGINVVPGGKLYLSVAHSDADIAETVSIAEEAMRACVA